ncbi:MAG: riboflavin synthase [Metallibacterium sp.]
MFTGIIQAIGTLARSEPRGGDLRLHIACDALDLGDVARGDSIAVSGVCLTAIELGAQRFAADVSRETLACTTLGALRVGAAVNLEKALRVGDALGGHLVAGHVDGVGHVLDVRADARSQRWRFAAPAELARYIAGKGSICIDGVSLTVNEVDGVMFGVNLIPHTVAMTTFGQRAAGDAVNLEVDLLARYVERMLGARPG